jgi:hypothetical protein
MKGNALCQMENYKIIVQTDHHQVANYSINNRLDEVAGQSNGKIT